MFKANQRLYIASLYLFIFLSGSAGLGYEIVWSRMLSIALGHETIAVLAVIAAFFTGLALGAYYLDGLIRRSRAPGHWYAACELVISAWSLALIWLIPWFNRSAPSFIGIEPSVIQHWAIAFLGTLLLLLPATAAMGATLPAMERLFSRLREDGWHVGGLYAANTFGAVAGTMATIFLIAPRFGFTITLLILASINFVCALGVLAVVSCSETVRQPGGQSVQNQQASARIAVTLFLTGLLGIGYEVIVIRVMSKVLEDTVYTFAAILSVYLFGTALGASLYQRHAPHKRFDTTLTFLLEALSIVCFIGIGLLWAAVPIIDFTHRILGSGSSASIAGELGLAFVVFFLPTLLMGATFSHLAQATRELYGLGRALGVNTLGASLAPLLFGVILLPLLGAKTALVLVSLAYLLLMPRLSWRFITSASIPVLAGLALLLSPVQLRFINLPPGGETVAYVEGVMAAVSVVRDAQAELHLKVNDQFTMGGTATYYSDRRQAHIPLLLHPNPKDALFLGIGTGITFTAASDHPDLSAVGVELIPEMIPLLHHFEAPEARINRNERLRIVTADARRFVRATGDRYDVIVADLFHPSRDGAGALYTVEHFEAIRSLLRRDGLFCQWLPLYQIDLPTLRTIVRTFRHIFRNGQAYLAHYSLRMPILGLIASKEPVHYTGNWLSHRVRDRTLAQELEKLRLDSDFALFGNLLAGNESLQQFAGEGPLNRDNFPVVTFQAPYFTYSQAKPVEQLLLTLVDEMHAQPADLLGPARNGETRGISDRLQAYWRARDQFLRSGVGITHDPDPKKILREIREPLLSVVRMSSDFTPAYDPLLAIANALFEIDASQTRTLLIDLEAANPRRTEARLLRDSLFAE